MENLKSQFAISKASLYLKDEIFKYVGLGEQEQAIILMTNILTKRLKIVALRYSIKKHALAGGL